MAILKEDDDGAVINTAEDKENKKVEPDIEVIEESNKKNEDADDRLEVTGAADEADEEEHGRRRETAKERRERAKLAKDRDRKELDFQRILIKDLENKLSEVSKQTAVTQVMSLQQQLQVARDEEARFASVSEAAQKANNVTDAFAAERIREDAGRRAVQIEGHIRQISNHRPAPAPAPPAPFLDHARAFANGKSWYDPNGRNEDSAIVLAIDQILANEPGMNPNSPEYWDELEKRASRRLPHRFKKTDSRGSNDVDEDIEVEPETASRRGPPVGGGRSASGPATTITLSRERVQALKDANMWEDPVMVKRMAQRYADHDRQNKTSARR